MGSFNLWMYFKKLKLNHNTSNYEVQNLKSKNKEIYIKTEIDKIYKNNEINRLEFMY
jgi:hypothetical protein